MKPINSVKLIFPSKSSNEAFARSAVSSFAAQADPTANEIAEIKTAVSEAVTNCIVHAYKNEQGNITMSMSLHDDNKITVCISDKGCGISDVKQAMEPLFTTGGDERAGLGFAVMESFSDALRVRSKCGKGTSVTIIKQLGRK